MTGNSGANKSEDSVDYKHICIPYHNISVLKYYLGTKTNQVMYKNGQSHR